jgi:hypothetical protein
MNNDTLHRQVIPEMFTDLGGGNRVQVGVKHCFGGKPFLPVGGHGMEE